MMVLIERCSCPDMMTFAYSHTTKGVAHLVSAARCWCLCSMEGEWEGLWEEQVVGSWFWEILAPAMTLPVLP